MRRTRRLTFRLSRIVVLPSEVAQARPIPAPARGYASVCGCQPVYIIYWIIFETNSVCAVNIFMSTLYTSTLSDGHPEATAKCPGELQRRATGLRRRRRDGSWARNALVFDPAGAARSRS